MMGIIKVLSYNVVYCIAILLGLRSQSVTGTALYSIWFGLPSLSQTYNEECDNL